MENYDELGDQVEREIGEIVGNFGGYEKGLKLNALEGLDELSEEDAISFYEHIAINYEVKEDLTPEVIDELVKNLSEMGVSETKLIKFVDDLYGSLPTREIKTLGDKATELAKTYLSTIVDEVIDGRYYLHIGDGKKLPLYTGKPEFNEDGIRIPINLTYRRSAREEDKRRFYTSFLTSVKYIVIVQPLGDYKINGPTKDELRQSALEAVLDNS